MFDKALLARLGRAAPVAPPLSVPRVRARPVDLGRVRLVSSKATADSFLDEFGALQVAHVALGFSDRPVSGNRPAVPMAGAIVVVAHVEGELIAVRYAFDLRYPEAQLALGEVVRSPRRIVVHDLRPICRALAALGLPWPRAIFSTQLAAQLLDLGRVHVEYEVAADRRAAEATVAAKKEAASSLLGLAQRFGVVVPASAAQFEVDLGDGAAMPETYGLALTAEAAASAAVYGPIRGALTEAGLDWHYDNVELPGAVALTEIAFEGARLDPKRLALAQDAARAAVSAYEARLVAHGLTSPRSHEGRAVLLRKLGLVDLFRTPTGVSFDEDRLKEHRSRHEVVELLYLHSKFSHLLDGGLFDGRFVGADGRVRPSVDPLGSATGRPTFRGGNLPGIGRVLRPIVVPDGPGLGLVELDFKAQEVFIAAAHFGDKQLIADCNAGDIYLRMVRELCGADLEDADTTLDDGRLVAKYPHQRERMKLFTLTTMYGGHCETSEFRSRFFARYPKLKEGMERAVHLLRQRGYAEGPTGAKRYRGVTGALSAWERRWAVNTVIQGGGACVLKLLLPRLQRFLRQRGGRVVLAIHDAVLIQVVLHDGRVPSEVVEGAKSIMVDAMRELYPATLPRVSENDVDPTCWNKDGHADSIERFMADPMFRL